MSSENGRSLSSRRLSARIVTAPCWSYFPNGDDLLKEFTRYEERACNVSESEEAFRNDSKRRD